MIVRPFTRRQVIKSGTALAGAGAAANLALFASAWRSTRPPGSR
jgi:hypothetical protein